MADSLDEYGLPLWPAAERNKQPILEQLQQLLPASGGVLLEIASATGQHAVHFASNLSHWQLQPTDYDEQHLETLRGRQKVVGLANFLPPLALDVTEEKWPIGEADVIYNANMVHIAPWAVAEGLFRGAARLLQAGRLLITYGPYKVEGAHTAPSNQRFDESLRSRDSSWGVRDLGELAQLAADVGFTAREPIEMPANNFLVVWDKG